MRTRTKILLGAAGGFVTVCLVGAGILAYANRPLSRAEVDRAVQDRLEAAVEKDPTVSAAVFATYSMDDETLHQYAAGAALDDAAGSLDANAPFHAASVGKTMLAVVIGQLIDEGRLSLSDPVIGRVGTGVLDGLFVVDGVDHAERVTIGQLLSHTSGIADYFDGPVRSGPTMLETIAADPDRVFSPLELVAFSREGQTPIGRPGERFSYSDTGYVLLGLAIEAIERTPYAEVLQRRIFAPLGMHDSFLFTASGAHPRMMPLHAAGIDLSRRNALTVDWAGGGVVSTTRDLSVFMRAFVSGELVSDRMKGAFTRFEHEFETGIRYGMGLMQFRFAELSPMLFMMGELYGAVGSTGTYALYDAKKGIVYTANYGSLEFGERAIEELVQLRLIVERLAE